MSEILTITGGHQGTTLGTLAAATSHMQTRYGSGYATWLGLSPDDQKRTLIAATEYIDRQSWKADADTFAKRDALAAFPKAAYELAALLSEDDTLVTMLDGGAELSSVGASGVSVSFRERTAKRGAGLVLPGIVAQLVGKYLVTAGSATAKAQSSNADNPFEAVSDCDRTEPY